MICYSLECACGERFEAWFRNAKGCDEQIAAGAVSCPACAGVDVSKALMAPAVPKKENASAPKAHVAQPESGPGGEAPAEAAPASSDASGAPGFAAFASQAIEEKLRALRAHIEKTAEPVGKNFAKEARAIHEGEAEERPIYGEATREEAEELLEDGVPVAPIPWIDKKDN